jgi:cytoskeleton protein RodZ
MNETITNRPGETLRKSREKLGLTLSDVSVAIKVNSKFLSAIEEGRLEGLPPRSFTRGFIRSYAAYLKLDPLPIITDFQLQDPPITASTLMSANKAEQPEENRLKTTKKITQSAASPKNAGPLPAPNPKAIRAPELFMSVATRPILIVSTVVLLVVAVGVKKVVDKYRREGTVAATQTSAPGTSPTNVPVVQTQTNDPAKNTATTAMPSTELNATPQTTNVNSVPERPATAPSTAQTDAVASAPVQVVKPIAPPTPPVVTPVPAQVKPVVAPTAAATAPVAAPKPTASTTPVAATAAPTTPTAAVAKSNEIILEALDDVEVTIRIDGETVKRVKLKGDGVHTIRARGPVQIDATDGGLLNVIHNGQDKGVLGDLGKSTTVKY